MTPKVFLKTHPQIAQITQMETLNPKRLNPDAQR